MVLPSVVFMADAHVVFQPAGDILQIALPGQPGLASEYIHDRFDQIASCRFHDNLALISPFDMASSVINPGQEGQR